MRTLNRLLVIVLLLTAIVPLGTTVLLASLSREETAQQLQEALGQEGDGYRQSSNLGANERVNERIAAETEQELVSLNRKEHALRGRIALVLESLAAMQNRSDSLAQNQVRMMQLTGQERVQFAEFVRQGYTRLSMQDTGPAMGRLLARRLLGTSLGQEVDEDLRSIALARARAQLITAVLQSRETEQLAEQKLRASAGAMADKLTLLMGERDDLLWRMSDLQRKHDRAQQSLTLSDEQLADVRRETAEVQQEVLRMQSELAQIDARIRTRAERELIQKGLRAPRPGRFNPSHNAVSSGQFAWPAIGHVSAGFHDEHYLKFFGVPHEGMDIVVPQGTPVYAAADGVVFLARDGGEKGFSYILLGHRDGYATLYGHLSSFAVHTGDDVTQGQLIGYSGGTPGTHGAGPMTTAAHLHFEVMRSGVHVNPRPLLP